MPGMYTMKHKKKTTNRIKLKSWFICLEKKTFKNKPHMIRQRDNLSQHYCIESFATYRRAALVSLDGLEWRVSMLCMIDHMSSITCCYLPSIELYCLVTKELTQSLCSCPSTSNYQHVCTRSTGT